MKIYIYICIAIIFIIYLVTLIHGSQGCCGTQCMTLLCRGGYNISTLCFWSYPNRNALSSTIGSFAVACVCDPTHSGSCCVALIRLHKTPPLLTRNDPSLSTATCTGEWEKLHHKPLSLSLIRLPPHFSWYIRFCMRDEYTGGRRTQLSTCKWLIIPLKHNFSDQSKYYTKTHDTYKHMYHKLVLSCTQNKSIHIHWLRFVTCRSIQTK